MFLNCNNHRATEQIKKLWQEIWKNFVIHLFLVYFAAEKWSKLHFYYAHCEKFHLFFSLTLFKGILYFFEEPKFKRNEWKYPHKINDSLMRLQQSVTSYWSVITCPTPIPFIAGGSTFITYITVHENICNTVQYIYITQYRLLWSGHAQIYSNHDMFFSLQNAWPQFVDILGLKKLKLGGAWLTSAEIL